jgi:rare lipoprotein A
MKLLDRRPFVLAAVLGLALAACSDRQAATRGTEGAPSTGPAVGDYKIGRPYQVKGIWYYPQVDYDYRETGIASWYGPGFHGKQTANGERYDQMALTAAHRTLPMPSLVRVTNLDNGRSLVVRINDRGPFKNGRIIDLSYRAAQLLDFVADGTAKVRVEILDSESRRLAAIAQGRQAAENAPEAAPMVAVQSAPLPLIDTEAVENTAAPDGSTLPADKESTGQAQGTSQTASGDSRSKRGPVRPARVRRIVALGEAGDDAADRASPRTGTIMTHRSLAMAPGEMNMNGWDFAARERPAEAAGSSVGEVSAFGPDGTVTQLPVRRTSIFIQAGSFLRRDYATRLSTRLSVLGHSKVTEAAVGESVFFRVRLGPIASVEQADQLLQILQTRGFSDARVIVD